ncbi:hypothetical protein [Flavobacterium sp. ACN2]|nr:hypothetical protein [Flavobacterium sp. ACN2]
MELPSILPQKAKAVYKDISQGKVLLQNRGKSTIGASCKSAAQS